MSDIIIPATMSSDSPMSEVSDPFAASIVPNSFSLSIENEESQESNPFEHLELSPNKRYALWRRDMVEYWNPWWHQVLSSHSKLMEAELWAYGHVWKSDVFYGTMWEGPDYTGARPLGLMRRFGP